MYLVPIFHMHRMNLFQSWDEWEPNIYHTDRPRFPNKAEEIPLNEVINMIFLMSKA